MSSSKDLFTLRGQAADIKYVLAISPNQVGDNIFEVELKDTSDKPIQNTTAVLLRFSHVEMDMGIEEVELKPFLTKPGRYSLTGNALSMTGNWNVTLLVRRPNADDVTVPLKLKLTS